MDTETSLTLLLLSSVYYLKLIEEKKRKRKYAVRPINRARLEKGFFNNLLLDMVKNDHDSCFTYTRMTPHMFKQLLDLVRNRLEKDPTKRPIQPAQRLIVTLHYLSEGCSMQELAWGHMLGHATVWKIIHETLDVLWDVLAPIHLKPPTVDEWLKVQNGFFNWWNMPNCIGAVDGKHINIQAPKHAGTTFFNYKKNHSIVLMAVCDAYYRFTLVDIGAAGSNHDSAVFNSSGFGQSVLNKTLPIPEPIVLPNSNVILPHFFVADAAFPLSENIMRPYPGSYLSNEKRIFNYRLSRARRTIENTFGIFAQRWRIMRKSIIAEADTCDAIVKAAVVLHNFVQKKEEDIPENERRYCPTGYVDIPMSNGNVMPGAWREEQNQLHSVGRLGRNNAARTIINNRDKLCNYLSSPAGSVPWQLDYILKGSIPDK